MIFFRHRDFPAVLWLAALTAILFTAGCTTTPTQYWEKLKGDGFPGWSEAMGGGVRGSKDSKPSGYFTDRRSEQIEKDLGGFWVVGTLRVPFALHTSPQRKRG